MNRVQRIILMFYLPLTLLILLLDRLYPGENLVSYVKYSVVVSMFLWAAVLHKKYPEQGQLSLALFFTAAADFFLVYLNTIPALGEQVLPLGILCFTIAYLTLILVYQKNARIGLGELLAGALVGAVFLPFYLGMRPFVQGYMFYSLSLFGVILTYMAWTAICTLFRGYYSRKVSMLMAISGFSILISDLGVGLAIAHPQYLGTFNPLLVNLIWGLYIPGWVLVLLVIAEEKLYR